MIEVSIIIVNYKVEKELIACIRSIKGSTHTTVYEIIIVDNDEFPTITEPLAKLFPEVIYVKSNKNVGWGAGSNIGVRHAKGKYIYFLNPDCLVHNHAIDLQYAFIRTHPDAGVVSSLLVDKKGRAFTLQGSMDLTPLAAIFSLSILCAFFPRNQIATRYWLKNLKRDKVHQVFVPSLSSAIIRKDVFEEIGGFDERFFLYFEEQDLAKRIDIRGYKNYILPEAKVMHIVGSSSKKRNDVSRIFKNSRFYYFRKYYGIVTALFIEGFLRVNKRIVIISSFLIIAVFVVMIQYLYNE